MASRGRVRPSSTALGVPSRREVILQASAELFAARGYVGTSVDDIGLRSGVSGPAVYWHFSNKEALLVEMLVETGDRLLAGSRRIVGEALDPAAALIELVRWQVGFAIAHPEHLVVRSREVAQLAAPRRRQVHRAERAYIQLWVGALQALEPSMAADRAAVAVQAAIGLINAATDLRDGQDEAVVARLVEEMAMAALHRAAMTLGDP